eukprot:351742-Chlamydomonas_euryale.AAC.2
MSSNSKRQKMCTRTARLTCMAGLLELAVHGRIAGAAKAESSSVNCRVQIRVKTYTLHPTFVRSHILGSLAAKWNAAARSPPRLVAGGSAARLNAVALTIASYHNAC